MPTVAELERLEALVGLLAPLTQVQRGELIRADNWNTVVGALIEVARAVLAETREDALPVHEHAEQVSIGWLDPRLRTLLERGPISDPAIVSRIEEIDRAMWRVSHRVDHVDEDLTEIRNRVAEVSTRDLTRQSDVTAVRRSVEGLSNAKEDVLALRETLRSLQTDVRVAVEVGSRLILNGQPVDIAVIDQRIRDVESLRERLRTPTGELLDATVVERRLAELTTTLVTEDELDEALNQRPGRVPEDVLDQLRETLRGDLTLDFQASFETLRTDVTTSVNDRLAGVDVTIAQRISDALPGLQASVAATIRPELAAAVERGSEELRAVIDARLAEQSGALRGEFGARFDDLEPTISGIQRTTDVLAERMNANEQRLDRHDVILQQFPDRLTTLAIDEAASREALRAALVADLDQRQQAQTTLLDERLGALDGAFRQQIETVLAGVEIRLVDVARQTATEAIADEVRAATNQLRGDMRQLVQDELTGFQDRLPELVDARTNIVIEQLNDRVRELTRREFASMEDQFIRIIDRQIDERIR